MENSEKRGINIRDSKDLASNNPAVVLDALARIRDSGNRAHLPVLFDMLNTGTSDEIRKEILSILGSIKIRHSAGIFADAIANPEYLRIRKDLLSVCWQNDLDFSPYFPMLIQVIIDADWESAFEAFTIIENSEYFPSQETCNEEIIKIKSIVDQMDESKKYFLNAIIRIFQNYS
jgi:hypothetical protein